MLSWLESTAIARLVQESAWGYPIVLSSHAVGMAILVGIVLMINFRMLGLARAIPVAAMRPMFQVALFGLLINVVSGTMLFMASASSLFESNPFRIKIILLIVGGILLIVTGRRFLSRNPTADVDVGMNGRMIAAVSVAVWLGVIVAGRLIAYIDVGFY